MVEMEKKEFYKLYIPALELALKNDSVNYGFYVKSPEDYLDDKTARQIIDYLDDNEDDFTERVSYYFDAKSHNFPSIQNIDIDEYKKDLIEKISKIKKDFLIY
ncbi:hypothetical protein SAMN05880573_12634 [Chryseobacterium sp. RU33C]|nr:hypothetical protein SAMN05880573_12634 [Chryseobacterium sp. RU33C]